MAIPQSGGASTPKNSNRNKTIYLKLPAKLFSTVDRTQRLLYSWARLSIKTFQTEFITEQGNIC